MFEAEVFRNQMFCIEEILVIFLRLFDLSRSDSAPVELCPSSPRRYAPDLTKLDLK